MLFLQELREIRANYMPYLMFYNYREVFRFVGLITTFMIMIEILMCWYIIYTYV
jgi:hypothetical protein